MSDPNSQPCSPRTMSSVPALDLALWKASRPQPSNHALSWVLLIRGTDLRVPHRARISPSRLSGLLPQLCVQLVHFIFSPKISMFPFGFPSRDLPLPHLSDKLKCHILPCTLSLESGSPVCSDLLKASCRRARV